MCVSVVLIPTIGYRIFKRKQIFDDQTLTNIECISVQLFPLTLQLLLCDMAILGEEGLFIIFISYVLYLLNMTEFRGIYQ
jgi:hypothetical protein